MELKQRQALLLSALLLLTPLTTAERPQSRSSGSRPQSLPKQNAFDGYTEFMLDAMQQLLEGGGQFDRDYLAQLTECLNVLDPSLLAASDASWFGLVKYFETDGVPGDEWGGCLGEGTCAVYLEQNATAQDFHNVTIYEPCNYASNVAYYHDATQVCSHLSSFSMGLEAAVALGISFVHMGQTSCLWHGSHTYMGNVADNRFIEVTSLIAYQGAISELRGASAVLTDLSLTGPRPLTGIQLAHEQNKMFIEKDVNDWLADIQAWDMPSYWMTFAAIVTTVFTLALEDDVADAIINKLMQLFNFPPEETDFLLNHYIPEIRSATEYVYVSEEEKAQLQDNFISTLIKFVYAFLWQEWVIGGNPIFLHPLVNALGARLLPRVNAFANTFNDFPIYDPDLQNGENVYPGEDWCNPYTPHGKWHLEAASGLMDLVYLADHVHRIIANSSSAANAV